MSIEPIFFGVVLGLAIGATIGVWHELSQEEDVVEFPSVSYDELGIDPNSKLDQRNFDDLFRLSVEKKAPKPVKYRDFESLNVYARVSKIGFVLIVLFVCLYLSWQILILLSTEVRGLISVGIFILITLFVSTIIKRVSLNVIFWSNNHIGSSLTSPSVEGTEFEGPKRDIFYAVFLLIFFGVIFSLSFLTPTILGATPVQEVFDTPFEFENIITTILLELVRGSGYVLSIGILAMGIILLRPYIRAYWRF